jgi:imidazoleglycerol-phosphate dehydratase
MDDALVHCAIDVGGRPYYRGPLPSTLYDHWMRSFADNARATLHLRVLRGADRHHVVEAAFKALGLALRDALAETGDDGAVFSTKGAVRLREEEDGAREEPVAPRPVPRVPRPEC